MDLAIGVRNGCFPNFDLGSCRRVDAEVFYLHGQIAVARLSFGLKKKASSYLQSLNTTKGRIMRPFVVFAI